MLKQIVSVTCLSCLSISAWADVDKWRLFTRGESFSYSAANPVTAYIDFLIGPAPDNGELAFTRNILEAGFGYGNFEFSILHRNDYNLYFSRDAAEFAYLNKNRKTIPQGKRYDVDVWANQYQLSGAKIGFTQAVGKALDIHVAYSHLYGTESVSGYLGKDRNGEGGFISMHEKQVDGRTEKVLEGDLFADYFFVDDPLFRNKLDAPVGEGYAIDVGVTWRISDRLTFKAMGMDALGEIRWKDMPRIVASATSRNLQIAEDGSITIAPSFTGVETYENFTQHLTRRNYAQLNYRFDQWDFGYRHDYMSHQAFHRVSAGYWWGDSWGVHLAAELDSAALEFKLSMPVGELYFMIDDPNIDYTNTLVLGWNLNFRF